MPVGSREIKAFPCPAYTETDELGSSLFCKIYEKTDLGGDFVMFGDLLKNTITAFAGLLDITCLEREAKAFGSRIWFVNGEVTPPDSTVVPEVMIRIVVVDSESELGFAFHAVFGFWPISQGGISAALNEYFPAKSKTTPAI